LLSQRDQRIELRRPPCRRGARRERDEPYHSDGTRIGRDIGRVDTDQEAADEVRGEPGKQHPNKHADTEQLIGNWSVMTRSTAYPESMRCVCCRLRTSGPDPMSSASDSATCPERV
jgi:hypothetical protein